MVQADATGFSRKISQGDLSQNNATSHNVYYDNYKQYEDVESCNSAVEVPNRGNTNRCVLKRLYCSSN